MAQRILSSCLRLTVTQTKFPGCSKIKFTAERCIVTTSSQQLQIKKPPSPYAIFVKDKFPQVKQESPDEPAKEIFRKLAKEWSKASDDEKKKYEDIYSKVKEEYERQKAELTEEEKQELIQQSRLKKTLQSNKSLVADWHRKVKENPELQEPKRPPSQVVYSCMKLGIFKTIDKNRWKYYTQEYSKLSEKKKEGFNKQREQELEDYRIKKGEWIQRMVLLESPYANSLLSSLDIKNELKRLGKPPQPTTSFFGFLKAHKLEKGNRTVTEFVRDMKKLWQDISAEEKEMYKLEFIADKENYAIAVEHWKRDLTDLGKMKSVVLMEKVLNSRKQRKGVKEKS